MKCPKCGAKNGESNRFCRACGTRIEGLIDTELKAVPETEATDELALGERLFEVWQLYSSGELDRAMSMIQQAKLDYPDSASVNSLAALVYERKAETELDAGNVEAARELLDNAVGQYERIVGFTPASAEDRERIAVLKKRVRVDKQKRVPIVLPEWFATAKDAIRVLPWYAMAAAAVFMLVIIVAIVAWPSQPRKKGTTAKATVTVASRPNTPKSAAPIQRSAPPLQVYTFPAQPSQLYAITPPVPPSPAPAPPKLAAVQPVKLPSLPPLRVVQGTGTRTNAAQTARPPAVRNNGAEEEPEIPAEPANPDGATMLARAISLKNQGLNQEALVAAQQAILLFEREAVSGNNSTAANRGAENARKMIGLWQSGGDRTLVE